jgi:hypothetical protein
VKRRFLLLTACFLAVFCFSCKDHGIEPPPPPPKNPREYTWTRDTIAYPGSYQTLMNRIWGRSARDLYIVGHNDQPGPGTMFHYDGSSWSTTHFHVADGGTVAGAVSLSSVYGFASNDVWAVGERIQTNPTPPPNFIDSSLTIHFDGTRWAEVRLLGGRYLMDVWGTSSKDVWTGGTYGTLAHFDGSRWRRETLPLTIPPGGYFYVMYIGGTGNDVFLSANINLDSIGQVNSYLFERKVNSWSLADSFVVGSTERWGPYGFWTNADGDLFSFGDGVYEWLSGSWTKIAVFGVHITGMAGTTKNNTFAVSESGRIFHFNGTDWFEFASLADPSIQYVAAWTDGREAFVVGWTTGVPQKTVILHGK